MPDKIIYLYTFLNIVVLIVVLLLWKGVLYFIRLIRERKASDHLPFTATEDELKELSSFINSLALESRLKLIRTLMASDVRINIVVTETGYLLLDANTALPVFPLEKDNPHGSRSYTG